MSDGSFAKFEPPSLPDSTHTLAACSHDTTLATNAPVRAPIRLAGVHRPRAPVSSSPSPSDWSSLDWAGKAASSSSDLLVLWSIPTLLRTAYRESAQDRNGRFLSRHYCYICCSRLTQKISSLPNGGGSRYARKVEQTPNSVKSLSCSHKRFWVQEKEAFAGHRVCDSSRSRHVHARRCVPAWYARRRSRVTAISRSSLRPFLFASSSAISPTFLFRKGWSVDKKWFWAGVPL